MKYCLSALSEVDWKLKNAGRFLIVSEFDGALCSIAETPAQVMLPAATLEVLRRARSCSRLTLAFVSGRALADLQRRVTFDIILGGNHGLEIAGGGLNFEHAKARQLSSSVARACAALKIVLCRWPSAWIEEKGLTATVHFRKVEQRQHSSLLFAARGVIGEAAGRDLALRVGRQALEIRPRVSWDKGGAFRYIREKAGPFDACLCLGADRGDESMFRANTGGLNIRVGLTARTAATYYLSNQSEVSILLSHIVDVCATDITLRQTAAAVATAVKV